MKKNEVDSLSDKSREIMDILKEMESFYGNPFFEKNEQLEDFDGNTWGLLIQKLIEIISEVVKETELPFDYSQYQKYGNEEFWEEIQNEVDDNTEAFLDIKEIRHTDSGKRIKNYQRIFQYIYEKKENVPYTVQKVKLDDHIVDLYFRLLYSCESVIVMQGFSKRVFEVYLKDVFGLPEQDAKEIWILFTEDMDIVERRAIKKRLLDISRRLSNIEWWMKETNDSMQFLEYILLDEDSA